MQAIGKKQLEEVEALVGAEVDEILLCDGPDSVLLLDIGERHGVSDGDYATLVEAKKDALRRVATDRPVPLAEVMAQQLGMTLEEYYEWLDKQAKIFDVLTVVDNEDEFFHRPQQKKMSLPMLTQAPWETDEDFLSDLQEDAG